MTHALPFDIDNESAESMYLERLQWFTTIQFLSEKLSGSFQDFSPVGQYDVERAAGKSRTAVWILPKFKCKSKGS
jgi:hypothetical protein